ALERDGTQFIRLPAARPHKALHSLQRSAARAKRNRASLVRASGATDKGAAVAGWARGRPRALFPLAGGRLETGAANGQIPPRAWELTFGKPRSATGF